jgi:sugar phosphate isomerase/epimerase
MLNATTAAAAVVTIDDFSAPAPWVFSSGAEFPGARGSLDTGGPGETGPGAALNYDFTNGGVYVAMTLKLPAPLTATALGYSTTAVAIPTMLRVVDSTGQTLQYKGERPLESAEPGAWYREVIDLSVVSMHSGGANDGLVHQPITSIALIAGGEFQKGKAGVIGFDNVVAWDPAPSVVDPSRVAVPAPPGAAGLSDRLAVNIHFTSDDRALDAIRDAGFTRVRADLGWSDVERTAGTYDFAGLDALLGALDARGLRLHLILGYSNALYPVQTDPSFATKTIPAFAAMASAAAGHFAGKSVTYEIWNEEDTGAFWAPSPNAAQYASLCAAAIDAVHRADGAALVTTGGLGGFNLTFLEQTLAAGAAAGADAIGVHPYRREGPETASGDLAGMRAVVSASKAAGVPIWDTEWGYSSQWFGGGHEPAARMVQAQRVSRELLTAWALGFPLVVYYDIRDDGSDPTNAEHNFGLLQVDYAEKPAMKAVRALTRIAENRRFTGFLRVGFSTVHAMLLVGAHDRVVAIWNSEPNTVRHVSIDGPATAMDMFGAPLDLFMDGGQSRAALDESRGPVFIVFPNPPGETIDAGTGIGDAVAPSRPRDASLSEDSGRVVDVDASSAPRPSVDARATDAGSVSNADSGCGCRLVNGRTGAWLHPFILLLGWSSSRALRRRRASTRHA